MRTSRFWWHGLSFGKVGDLHPVEVNDCVRSIDGNVHRVPFADRLDRARQSFRKCVEHTGARIVVGPVPNLDLIASVDWHPRLGSFLRYANKDPRVGLLRSQFEHHSDCGMRNLFSRVPKHAHSALCLHHSVFHDKRSGTDLLPAVEILSIKQSTTRLLSG